MLQFFEKSLFEIEDILKEMINEGKELIEFIVINPDINDDLYSGSEIVVEGKVCIYRSYKCWSDLANILKCKFLTPIFINDKFVKIRYKLLSKNLSFHEIDKDDKYGVKSEFNKINKNEEISFLHYYKQALENIYIKRRKRILNLGVNKASEFDVLEKMLDNFCEYELVGIDISQSAINEARKKYSMYKNVSFYCHDINNLDELEFESFDLIISIGTLQSSNLDTHNIFRQLFQNNLKKDGAMIVAMPNSRWINGELIYGAEAKNYNFSEMSLVFKDISYFKKYLQQKKFRVMITGKEYIFLSATSFSK